MGSTNMALDVVAAGWAKVGHRAAGNDDPLQSPCHTPEEATEPCICLEELLGAWRAGGLPRSSGKSGAGLCQASVRPTCTARTATVGGCPIPVRVRRCGPLCPTAQTRAPSRNSSGLVSPCVFTGAPTRAQQQGREPLPGAAAEGGGAGQGAGRGLVDQGRPLGHPPHPGSSHFVHHILTCSLLEFAHKNVFIAFCVLVFLFLFLSLLDGHGHKSCGSIEVYPLVAGVHFLRDVPLRWVRVRRSQGLRRRLSATCPLGVGQDSGFDAAALLETHRGLPSQPSWSR